MADLVEYAGPLPLPELHRPEKRFRQLELEFVRADDPLAQEATGLLVAETATTTAVKQQKKTETSLKTLAKENRKVTSWLGRKDHQEEGTSKGKYEDEAVMIDRMEEDTPVLWDVETIVKKGQAKVKQAKLIRKLEGKAMVNDLKGMSVARSEVDKVMEEVLTKCTWIAFIRDVWRLLKDDQPLQEEFK